MKALFLSNDASIPDVASATRARMQAYAGHIGEMHVLLCTGKRRTTTDGAITIHEVKVPKILSPFLLPRCARELILKYEIEIVSAQDPFEHGFAAMHSVRGTKAKLHVQVHTDFISPWFRHGYTRAAFLNHIRVFLAGIVLPRANGIRVVSPRLKRSLMARYRTHIVEPTVIPIAVNREKEASKELEAPFSFTLLTVCRLEPEKHVEDILRALALVRKKYPYVGLVIAGEGSERAHLRSVKLSLDLVDWVRFLGTRTDIFQLTKASHAFVQASAFEGYGRSLIEAADTGIPIITTDVGVVGDVLMPNVHVLTFPVRDVPALAEQIISLIEDNAKRTTLSLAAQTAVAEHLREFSNQPKMIMEDLKRTIEHA